MESRYKLKTKFNAVMILIWGIAMVTVYTGLPFIGGNDTIMEWRNAFLLAIPAVLAFDIVLWVVNKSERYRTHAKPKFQWVIRKYLNFWRSRTPDIFYRLWLREGMINAETYREFQEQGIITSDLDPEHIQKHKHR